MTDIDDKIIARAAADGRNDVEGAAAIARRFESEFFRDMATLGVLPPDAVTRVTEFLPDIIRFVQVRLREMIRISSLAQTNLGRTMQNLTIYSRRRAGNRTESNCLHEYDTRSGAAQACMLHSFVFD